MLRELFHCQHFVLVYSRRNSLEFKWQTAPAQRFNSSEAPFVAAGYTRQSLVGLFGPTIECDFDRERRPFEQVICSFFGNEGPIGEQRDQKSFSLRLCVDLKEILTRKNLPAGIKEPKATQFRQFIQQLEMLIPAQLPIPSCKVSHRQIVVAVQTLEGTASCHFEGNFQGNPPVGIVIMDCMAQIGVGINIHNELVTNVLYRESASSLPTDQTGFHK